MGRTSRHPVEVRQRAVRPVAEQQDEYDSSRYAPRDVPVAPGHYRGFDEQEPTTGEGGESESSIASHRVPGVGLRKAAGSRPHPGRLRLLRPRRGRRVA